MLPSVTFQKIAKERKWIASACVSNYYTKQSAYILMHRDLCVINTWLFKLFDAIYIDVQLMKFLFFRENCTSPTNVSL